MAEAPRMLRDKIKTHGIVLGGGILKVSSFVNHQVDVGLMDLCGEYLANLFREFGPSKILTAQTSGILPAQACARHLGIPMIFAREKVPITMQGFPILEADSRSHTKGSAVKLIVSGEYLTSEDRVLIVDDFLASGTTAVALLSICEQAGASCVGMGFLIEKLFEGGAHLVQSALADSGRTCPVFSVVGIAQLTTDGRILFPDEVEEEKQA